MDNGTPSKRCSRCEAGKPLDEFSRSARSSDGHAGVCKPCSQAEMRAWRLAHPEQVKRARRTYYVRNRERIAGKDRAYREANRERIAEYQRTYWSAHRAAKADYLRAWRKANPEKWVGYRGRRRAMLRATSVGPIDFAALWTGLCGICDLEIDASLKHPDPGSRSLDHIMPLAAGGTHTQDNLQYAHLICNLVKGARVPERGDLAC